MTIPIFRPYVFPRCKKGNLKAEHVLLTITNVKRGEVEETYECQQRGETKIIHELTSISQLANHVEA